MNNDPNEFPSYNEPLPYSPAAQNAFNAASPIPAGPPPVVGWYKVYCWFMAVIYFLLAIGGILLLNYMPAIVGAAPELSAVELKIRAIGLIVVGFVLFVAFIVALLLPPSPGAWIYHVVLIALGLGSCCLWPVTIPLLIAWLKPPTQIFFGRHDPSQPPPPPTNPNQPPPPIPSV